QIIGACYASSLALKPVPSASGELADLLTQDTDIGVRWTFAHAIGVAGFDAATEGKLFEKLKNVETRNAAALALILGGSTDTAARTVAMYGEPGWKESLDDLKDAYYRSFGYWSDEDFKRGNLYRWVNNAIAISHVKIADAPQDWAVQRLQSQFDNLKFDNGPHSETRVVLRYRLWQAAKTGDSAQKKGAITTLQFMKEKGVLMALRGEQGEAGELAKKAFFELMNPKVYQKDDAEKARAADKAKQPKGPDDK
ncbi:MAG TPA: HEAT repeat domain-containing protein, partial [Byssovorax sp.]